jgi:tetratricopeptide (TPR) repeat protein
VTGAGDEPQAARVDRDTAFRLALDRHRSGRYGEAIALYRRIVATDPAYAPAWINLGVALRAEGRIAASIGCLRRGIALKPDDAGSLSNLGNALRAAGRLAEAASSHEAAIAIDPAGGSFRYNLGLVQRDHGDIDTALASFDAAVAQGYDTAELQWDRALALLLKGDLAGGFAGYEWRWQIPEAKPRGLDGPVWKGEDLSGKTLLVYAEQGFGDTIQFVRYLPGLRERPGAPARIVLECQPPLVRLFAGSPACAGVSIAVRDETPLPPFDYQMALLSLPRIAGTTAETIPADIPYLCPPSKDVPSLRLPKGFHVGIAWAGKPTHRNDRNRSTGLSALAPLLEIPGAIFHSLQLGDDGDAIATQGFSALLRDHRGIIRDFADSAALLRQLDLVISVDTAPVHLAGALGRPVWVLLPYAPDWRWQTGRTDSPWYPSMRLFRQPAPGDWPSVVAAACSALREEIDG